MPRRERSSTPMASPWRPVRPLHRRPPWPPMGAISWASGRPMSARPRATTLMDRASKARRGRRSTPRPSASRPSPVPISPTPWSPTRATSTSWPGRMRAPVPTSGTVYASSGILLAPGTVYWPALATDGSTVLLAWAVADSVTAHDIQGVRVQASSGTKLGSILELSKGPGARSSPAVSFAGGHFLVVWEDRRVDASVSELYGTRIRASDGAVLDASGIPIATAPANRPYGSNFAVGSDGNRFLVLWEQLTAPASTTRALQGVRVGTDGVVSDTASQPLSDVSTKGGPSPAVAFDGTNFLVLRRDVRNNRN